MSKLKRFRVSRAYITRMEWIVSSESEENALALLDKQDENGNDYLPSDAAGENWIGPWWGVSSSDCEDKAEALL